MNSSARRSAAGSSPLARGTRVCPALFLPGDRFIPAGAGNTLWLPVTSLRKAVHPRWRGEHDRTPYAPLLRRGSSPLARGTQGIGQRFVVVTGGEPLLQLDAALIDALHAQGFEIAVESNGTVEPPEGIDWLCISPKAGAPLKVRRGSELKLVFPQHRLMPDSLPPLEFRHFYLQPMDGPDRLAHTEAAVRYCLEHPQWRLSLQTHKLIGIP